jgi:dTDP-glucose 4,6-dehydratase
MKTMLITGGAGFIGSRFTSYIASTYPDDFKLIVLDALTYAGRKENIDGLPAEFIHADIRNYEEIEDAAARSDIIVNFAAETFVDKAIADPGAFVTTDVIGVYNLLEAVRKHGAERFIQISTDEVYGEVMEGEAAEDAPIKPRNPYSASKAGGELLARSYHITYGLPVIITRCSNNYGPYQHPEKLIPKIITNAIRGKEIPIYGDGSQIRDWIYVYDHCRALDAVLFKGDVGEVYNISAGCLLSNIELTKTILRIMDKPERLIKYVDDRPGHDRRYAIDSSKVRRLGWTPKHSFEEGMRETINWYLENQDWWQSIKNAE